MTLVFTCRVNVRCVGQMKDRNRAEKFQIVDECTAGLEECSRGCSDGGDEDTRCMESTRRSRARVVA